MSDTLADVSSRALPQLRTTRRASIAEEIIEQLRDVIFAGQLVSGTRLDETMLARQFGVSRASLREALNQLAGEGLLVYRPNRGMFVREYDERAARDLFAVRTALEPLAASLAASHASEEDLARLRELTAQLAEAAVKQDWPATMRCDALLHVAVAESAGNEVLARVLQSLRSETHLLVSRTGPQIYTSPEIVIREHEALVDAIQARDAARAAKLARNHLDDAAKSILGPDWATPVRDVRGSGSDSPAN